MRPTDHGLRDPGDCESRKDIELSICGGEMISLKEGCGNWIAMSLEDFLCEIEQRCQDSLHNIFDQENDRHKGDVFETLAQITRPDPIQFEKELISAFVKDLIEDNSRSDADPGL